MPQRKRKLLVVDDQYFNRYMLKERLVGSGFEVAEAEDAREALDVIGQGGIDLVLLDTMIPGMSGIELLKLLRAVHGPSELPVIMATAVSDSESIAGALEMGANDYISKPIDFPVMLARIASQLNRKESEQKLRESEERYALASRGADDGIWDWDLATRRVFYSTRWKSMCGLTEQEVGSSPEEWLGRVHPDDASNLNGKLESHWGMSGADERPFVCEYRLLHKNGGYRWMRSRGHTLRDATGRPVRMTGLQADITDQKVYDPLTGLANRLLFLDRAGQSLDAARQHPERSFAMLFLDIDRFKLINDTMGHMAGDRLLVGVAERLSRRVLRNKVSPAWDDLTVARFGGDEFAVLLDDVRDRREPEQVAEQVVRAFDEPLNVNGREVFCSVSIGIAIWNPTYASVEDLLRDADTAMYGAKGQGGSRFVVFDDTMRQRVAARLEIETGLRTAIERKELAVHYQPKVNLDTNLLVGFEALVRWNHPRMGLVGPAEFIAVAEETGLIVTIGDWVLREACRQLADWQVRYPKMPALSVSVNLSMRQFRQPDIAGASKNILQETGLAPQYLHLEITESVVMDNPDGAIATANKLKALGVGIKLDDFGTGYSSLTHLCRMPIDTLKIDRSFIVRMSQSNTDLEIVRTVLTLARSLEMEVVAEGVERDDQMNLLRALGCQFGQGYYFGRPISPEETERLLASTGVDGSPLSKLRKVVAMAEGRRRGGLSWK